VNTMALRDLLPHCARPLSLAHDPSLIPRRPLPTNPLAGIGSMSIANEKRYSDVAVISARG